MDGRETACFAAVNVVAADLRPIDRAKDPRSYVEALGELGCMIPEIAAPVLSRLVERLIGIKGRPVTILDVGCSYGLLAATMRYRLSMAQLRDRYAAAPIQALSSDQLASYDTHYFAGWPRCEDVRFIGLDRSAEAIAYALRVGLIEEGLVVDLERNAPNKRARSVIAKVDLIVSTGTTGCASEKTFAELLEAFPAGEAPWIASFVPRMFDYRNVAETISRYDLMTERLDGVTFVQRRFRDADEFEDVLRLIQARGLDPAGKEAGGIYHAELFVSRPPAVIAREALYDIVQPVGGQPMVAVPG